MKKKKKLNTYTLAAGIALLPPAWAVLAPYLDVSTGAVALICAGLYVTNGNQIKNAFKITLGFLLGDVWAVLAIKIMDFIHMNENIELYLTLFVLGGAAVIIGSIFEKYVFVPAWLCGWAIGLTILAPRRIDEIGSLPIQIGVAMVVGVWYVGVGVDLFQRLLLRVCTIGKERG